jgi:hypothetical protein
MQGTALRLSSLRRGSQNETSVHIEEEMKGKTMTIQEAMQKANEGGRMLQEAVQKLRVFVIRVWYFIRNTSPADTALEEHVGNLPETQAQRILRRWRRSRQRHQQARER